jgi:hypothetical protein
LVTENAPQIYISGRTSENCITLNTWAPLYPGNWKDKLLVFLCLFEGAFKWGRGNTPGQDPSSLIARNSASFLSASVRSHPRFFTSLSPNENVALESTYQHIWVSERERYCRARWVLGCTWTVSSCKRRGEAVLDSYPIGSGGLSLC